METYVLMTKLSTDALHDPKGRRAAGHAWKKKVERLCPNVEWIGHFVLLGPYDFMSIYRAPDEQTAFKVSLISRSEGALSAESWPAMSYEEFLPMFEELSAEHAG